MNADEFEQCFESLTQKQKAVLWPFLDYCNDQVIARELDCQPCTIRHHIANLCKKFGFTNGENESYSYRHDLVEVFIQHRPEKVSPQWQARLMDNQVEEPDFPGRPLMMNSRYYLERPPVESRALKVLNPGALVRIRGPRKTGKTSLLYRTLNIAKHKGYQTAAVKLYRAEPPILANVEHFLKWFCLQVSDGVGISNEVDAYWSSLRGNASSCSQYLQSHILEQLEQPLIVSIDEADRLFEYPQTAKVFFGLVRGWSEEARTSELWQQFRQVVVYATDVYIDFDVNQSPFNVGIPLRLLPLNGEQIQRLASCYGLKDFSKTNTQALRKLVGGHPHLVQLALYHTREGKSIEQILATANSQMSIFSDHLQTISEKLSLRPELTKALQKVVIARGQKVALDSKTAKQLEGLALVIRESSQVKISCQLYQDYFEVLGW